MYMQGLSGQIEYLLSTNDSVPANVSNWFFINPANGAISVISNLREDPSKTREYIVSTLNWIMHSLHEEKFYCGIKAV